MPCAFVAMPFAQNFYPVYQTIKSACEALGITTLRIDEVWARDDIYKQIEEEILKADFVVADFTGDRLIEVANPNVVHEATFARVKQKYIVLLAQDHKCLPFDWRTRPAIIYQQTEEGLQYLGERLKNAITALMQKGDFGLDRLASNQCAAPLPAWNASPGSFSPLPLPTLTPLSTPLPDPAPTPLPAVKTLVKAPSATNLYESSPAGLLENLLRTCEKEALKPWKRRENPLLPGFIEAEDGVLCQKDKSLMAYIPAGKFMMGAEEEEEQKPIHEVALSAYLMDLYPVTNLQYRKFMEEKGYETPGFWTQEGWKWRTAKKIDKPLDLSEESDLPVVGVSWYEAMAYAVWAGKHLPTEAQWEYAARGDDDRIYPWGDQKPCRKLANYKGSKGLSKVGKYRVGVSPFGCYDMAGNVWEWCYDWYEENYYSHSSALNPLGPKRGKEKVSRGGSWNYDVDTLKAFYRFNAEPSLRNQAYGFRCARVLA